MRRVYVLVAAMMCACGQVDAPELPRCNPDSPFGTPVPIAEINTAASDEFAYLSPDELTMYFSSTRTDSPATLGGYDIFKATRPNLNAPWENILPVSGVNTSGGNERRPMVTGDGATMYALIGNLPDRDIGIATQRGTTAAFTSFTVAAVSSVGFDDDPGTILPDHHAIWFSSNRSGNDEIYSAPGSGAELGTAVLVSGVNVNDPGADETYPVVTPDELTLFFSRNRRGGAAGYEILVATRANAADPFDGVEIVQAVSAAPFNVATWVSADGCVLYTMSGPMQGGPYDVFVATRGM
jgi:Tol biopolymer transport system component